MFTSRFLFRLTLTLVLSSLCPVWAAPTDPGEDEWTVIRFADGREIRCTILEVIPPPESGLPVERLRIRTDQGVRTDVYMSRIAEIIRPEDRADDFIALIQQRLVEGDVLAALEAADRLQSLDSESLEARQWAVRAAWEVYLEAKRLSAKDTIERAFEHWDALALSLQGRPLINPNPQPGSNYNESQAYEQDLVAALQIRVSELITEAKSTQPADPALLTLAMDQTERLLSLDSNNHQGQLSLILIHEARGDLAEALGIAEALKASLPAGQNVFDVDMIDRMITSLQSRITERTRTEVAQAPPTTPQVTPQATPGTGRRPAPTPQATQVRPGTQQQQRISPGPSTPRQRRPSVYRPPGSGQDGGGGLISRIMSRLGSGEVFAIFGDVFDWAGNNGPILGPIIFIGVFILVFWVIPYRVAKAAAGRGSMSASMWAPRIKRWGLAAAVFWALSPIVRIGGKKKAPLPSEQMCPQCQGDLSNLELYRDLNFLVCPHCGEGITPIYDLGDYIRHLINQIDTVRRGREMGSTLDNKIEREAMLKLVRAVMTMAVRQRASDLHVDASGDGLDLRSRVDGILAPLEIHVPKAVEKAFVSAIKVMANLDITESRTPQDGRFEMAIDGAKIDVRINTSPTGLGEKISMRMLDVRNVELPLEKLGITDEVLPAFRRSINSTHGLMLVTGPTGSGKSTTLYVCLNEINNGARNIITIEDPIEYIFKGLNQHQVNPAANFTFATGLRSIIRQDPDVIMVGEIRDRETADISVDAATTGHLVMTTLHTIDAVNAYQRMAEIGVEPRRFAPTMLLICAQRLMRLTCTNCKESFTPDPSQLGALEIGTAGVDLIFYKGKGCELCHERGYRGRLGLFEVIVANEEIRALMEGHSPTQAIREAARRAGMRSLREEGIQRVLSGLTTPEEILRVIS